VAQRQRFLDPIEAPAGGASMVAVAGDQVVGHVQVNLEPYRVAGLGMMVAAGWRGRGVGAALVQGAIACARDLGAHKLALQLWPHNDAARRLYLRHGFVEEGLLRRHYRRRNGELWDAVIMGLVLDETSPGCSLPA
jgi:RimJ/RimL family protein N-acetyltransferase